MLRLWPGGLLDFGAVGLWRTSTITGSQVLAAAPVAGIEQTLARGHLQLRAGWNEWSPTGGISVKVQRFKLDVAYVYNLAIDRTQGVFGSHNNAVLATLTFDYEPRSPSK